MMTLQFPGARKTGINAKFLVIPGEDPAELEVLASDYQEEFEPASPLEYFLVETLIHADWQLRRLRRVEAQLWTKQVADAEKSPGGVHADALLGHVFNRGLTAFTQLQRRIDATERSYFRALKQLQALRTGPFRAADSTAPSRRKPSAQVPATIPASPNLASFRDSPEPLPSGPSFLIPETPPDASLSR
jgi:hypothetical protein